MIHNWEHNELKFRRTIFEIEQEIKNRKTMEKKFAFPVCYQVTAENQAEIVDNLLKIGYYWDSIFSVDDNIIDNRLYLCTNYNYRNKGLGMNSDVPNDRYFTEDLDLFYALAAMTENEEFFEGEICFWKGHLPCFVKLVRKRNNSRDWVSDLKTHDSLHEYNLRKATKEEIIVHFKQKEADKEIEKLVNAPINIQREALGYPQIKNKTMETKEFTAGGNKYLKQALMQDLIDSGIDKNKYISSWYLEHPEEINYIGLTDTKVVSSFSNKSKLHYDLGTQYNEAKQAFLDALQPKEIKTTFKGKEIVLTKKGFKYQEHELSVKDIKILQKELVVIDIGKVRTYRKMDIGCDYQFQNVTYSDLSDLLELHAIKFPKE